LHAADADYDGNGVTDAADALFLKNQLTPDDNTEEDPEHTDSGYETWENIKWKFDETSGTLYIRGNGAVPSCPQDQYPWYRYRETKFAAVVVEEGITELNASAIHLNRWSYTALSLPSTLTYIDPVMLNVFNDSLQEITVAKGGMYFAQDNVLYRKNGDEIQLICYPAGLKNTSFTVPSNVTGIGEYSFSSEHLAVLVLPEGLRSIGAFAFRFCTALKQLGLPASVSNIHEMAFHSCESLESFAADEKNPYFDSKDGVLFTEKMDTLYAYPVSRPGEEYTVPDGVRCVLSPIAMTASKLEILYLPGSVTEWRYLKGDNTPKVKLRAIYVDENNPCLTSENGILYNKDKSVLLQYPYAHTEKEYRMPDTVTVMQTGSFRDTAYLQKIWWGKNLETMAWDSELGESVTEVYFPGDVPSWLNDVCFRRAAAVTLYYPTGSTTWTDGTMTVGKYTYKTASYDPEMEGKVTEDGYTVWKNIQWKFDSSAGKLYIRGTGSMPALTAAEYPWSTLGYSVTDLAVEEGITSLTRQSMSQIYPYRIQYPSTLESAGNAFMRLNNQRLKSYTVAEGGRYYAVDGVLFAIDGESRTLVHRPFDNTSGADYVIPEGTTHLGEQSMIYQGLINIKFPVSLKSVAYRALGYTTLESVSLGKNVEFIDPAAFVGCTEVTSYTVNKDNPYFMTENGILYTADGKDMIAYPYSNGVSEFSIPDGVTEVPLELLYYSVDLQTLNIPASVTSILSEGGSYDMVSSLQQINVDKANTVYSSDNGILYSADRSRLICYPVGKKDTLYVIPSAVRNLSSWSIFGNANLISLVIPDSVTSMDTATNPRDCANLRDIYFTGDLPKYWNNGNFRFLNTKQITLHYPEGAAGWSEGSWTSQSGYTFCTASYPAGTAPWKN